MKTALNRAISVLGTSAELARVCGQFPQAVTRWKQRGGKPPAHHCVAIELATGVRCEELRPDLVWTRNEAGQVTGYHVAVSVDRTH